MKIIRIFNSEFTFSDIVVNPDNFSHTSFPLYPFKFKNIVIPNGEWLEFHMVNGYFNMLLSDFEKTFKISPRYNVGDNQAS